MLKSILAWLDPRYQGRGINKHHVIGGAIGAAVYPFIHILLVLAAVTGGVVGGKTTYDSHFWASRHTTIVQKAPLTTRQTKALLTFTKNDVQAAGCYVPPMSLFRIANVYAVIQSQYWYDNFPLHGVACQDTDGMTCYGCENNFTAPGPAWVHYTVIDKNIAAGSGWYLTLLTPGDGHIAFFHVHYPRVNAGQVVRGGTILGQNGWPYSYAYSNNSCGDYNSCKQDAHLCISTDAAGASWLWTLTYNPPKRPIPKPQKKPFSVRAFESWRTGHHEKPVAWKDQHGRLTWSASIYRAHPQLGGIKSSGAWHQGTPGYTKYAYAHGTVWAFPSTGKYVIRWAKR